MLRVHIPGEKIDLLSFQASGFQRGIVLAAVLDRLVHKSFSSPKLQPGLLENWGTGDSGRTWTLKLKPHLKFHHGREVRAQDLEFSLGNVLVSPVNTPDRSMIRSIVGADSVSRNGSFASGSIAGMSVIDEITLKVVLEKPDPMFVTQMDSPVLSPVPREHIRVGAINESMSSAASGSHLTWKDKPIGAGPYSMIASSNGGSEIILERFSQPQCSYPWLRTSARKITVCTGPLSEKTDVTLSRASLPSNFRVVNAPAVERIVGLYFNFDLPVVRDVKFRRAIDQCIDRDRLKPSLPGELTSTVVPSSMEKISIRARPHQPQSSALAFQELREKYPELDSLEVRIGTDPKTEWLEIIEDSLQKAGLPISFRTVPKGINFSPDEPIPFMVAGFIPSVNSVTDVFKVFEPGGGWVTRLDSPDERYLKLLESANLSENSRGLAQHFYDQCYAIPLFEVPPQYTYNEESVLRMNEAEQAFDVYLDKISVKEWLR